MAGLLYDPAQPLSLIEMVNNPAWMGVKPTLGQRNNNWGNLRTTDAFEGKTGTNKSYDTYETPEKGLRALARVLDTYSSKHGIDTIDALVNRYAPASDNTGGSHENYKKFIAQQLGVGINDTIDVKGRRAELMDAIIRFENKNRPLASQEQLLQAIADADGKPINEGTKPMNQFFGYHQDGQKAALTQPIGSAAFQPSEIEKAMAESLRAQGVPEHEIGAYIEGQRARQADGTVYNDMGTVMPHPVASQMNGDGDGSDAADEGNQLMQSGILMSPANAATRTPSTGSYSVSQLPPEPTMSPPVSGQRRDQSAMSFPSMIDKYDMAIRIGGRGAAAASKGGLAAIGAMTDEYGKIRDAENKSALDIYKAALKGDAKNAKQARADQEQIGQIDQALFDMNKAKEYLAAGNLTGLFDNNIVGFFDKLSGNKRAVGRKLLEKLRVDDTLLRIAQTKGAISNKEMELFLAPSPDLNDQESVWEQWINDRIEALNRVRTRLSGGQQVAEGERASADQVNQFGSSFQASPQPIGVGQSTTINGVTVKRIN